jgi:hypothetical protein
MAYHTSGDCSEPRNGKKAATKIENQLPLDERFPRNVNIIAIETLDTLRKWKQNSSIHPLICQR